MITTNRPLAPGTDRGPMQGVDLIGEITESLHRHLMDNWEFDRSPPRIEEDLSFVPKDREEVIYVYMYKAVQNTALLNSKRFRGAKFNRPDLGRVYYERAPLYLDLFYLIAVHSKFRSDAERLLGFVMLAMHESTHLLYRPRRYVLPGGDTVNSNGEPWTEEYSDDDENIIIEKVSFSMEDDLSIGDAINFFTIHEAPYRPYLTYCARCAMEGALVGGDPTTVRSAGAEPVPRASGPAKPSGRLPPRDPPKQPSGRFKTPFGPKGHNPRRIDDESSSESEE
jgi:hypothetical protein